METKIKPVDIAAQYSAVLSQVQDMRLVILLAFNSFEEAVNTLLAWRWSCSREAVPDRLSVGLACELLLCGLEVAPIRRAVDALRALRNEVAHGLHRDAWGPKQQKGIIYLTPLTDARIL